MKMMHNHHKSFMEVVTTIFQILWDGQILNILSFMTELAMSNLRTNNYFETNLYKELVDPVCKTGLLD